MKKHIPSFMYLISAIICALIQIVNSFNALDKLNTAKSVYTSTKTSNPMASLCIVTIVFGFLILIISIVGLVSTAANENNHRSAAIFMFVSLAFSISLQIAQIALAKKVLTPSGSYATSNSDSSEYTWSLILLSLSLLICVIGVFCSNQTGIIATGLFTQVCTLVVLLIALPEVFTPVDLFFVLKLVFASTFFISYQDY